MKPSNFPQATGLLHRPASMTDEECESLHVHRTRDSYISCWRPTWRERFALIFGAPVWLWVTGDSHPPVSLQTEDPFRECPNHAVRDAE